MSITALLEAARYLEQNEFKPTGDMEVAIATGTCTFPLAYNVQSARTTPQIAKLGASLSCRSQGAKLNHTILEKNRRAALRKALGELREKIPPEDRSRNSKGNTTVGLLRTTECVIRRLQNKEKVQSERKENLEKEQELLKRRIMLLKRKFANIQQQEKVHASTYVQPRLPLSSYDRSISTPNDFYRHTSTSSDSQSSGESCSDPELSPSASEITPNGSVSMQFGGYPRLGLLVLDHNAGAATLWQLHER